MKKLLVGRREVELLMDALIALESQWTDFEVGDAYGPGPDDHRRMARLMDKLRALRGTLVP